MNPTLIIDRVENPTNECYKEIHVSSIKEFLECEYKSFNKKQQYLNKDWEEYWHFHEWRIVEEVIAAYCYGPANWDHTLYNHFWNSKEYPMFNNLKKHANNFVTQYAMNNIASYNENKEWRVPLFYQKKMELYIHLNPYIFILSWTPDMVWTDYTISDFKTSKSEWKEKDLDWLVQNKVYPRMLKIMSNHPMMMKSDEFMFDYFVFTKHKEPRFQHLKWKWNYLESQELVLYALRKYRDALINWPEPKENFRCRACPLKNECPLHKSDLLSIL